MADTIYKDAGLDTDHIIQLTPGILTLQNSPTDSGYSIGLNDPSDYIKFTVSRSSNVVVKLQPQGGDLSLAVLDSNGQPILSRLATNNPNSMADVVVSDPIDPLQPGQTYYIRVSGNTPTDVNYVLNIDTKPTTQADIVWRDSSSVGNNYIWRMDGTTITGVDLAGPAVSPPWLFAGIGDLSGDGSPDYLWRNLADGMVALWTMDSTGEQIRGVNILPSVGPSWFVSAISDFNGDGKPDVLWRDSAGGATAVWLMDGINFSAVGSIDYLPDPAWFVSAAIPNVIGDGNQGLFYRNYVTGENVMWLMDGTKFVGSRSLPSKAPTWFMYGTGDFNGDGQQDLLWRDVVDGSTEVWFMNGTTSLSSVALPPVPVSEYTLVGVINNKQSSDLAGNTPTDAFDIGTLKDTASYGDVVGPTDTSDFYKFTLDSASKVGITAFGSGVSTRTNFDILAADGVTVVASASANGNDQKALADLDLDAGTYYVRVQSLATSDTRYNINITGTPNGSNLLFPSPEVVTYKLPNGTSFTSSDPVSVATPFAFDMQYSVTYTGSRLNQFDVGFYLSKDNTLTNAYRLDLNGDNVGNQLDVAQITGEAPNTTITRTQRLTLPKFDNPFWQGRGSTNTYNIIIVLDPENKIQEIDPTTRQPAENDNTFANPIQIQVFRPDLTPQSFTAASPTGTFTKGGRVNFSGVVQNIGTDTSNYGRSPNANTTVAFYLSQDNVFSRSTDLQLTSTQIIGSLAAGTSFSIPAGVGANLPTTWAGYSLPPGTPYYLLMVIDPNGSVNELPGATANNTAFQQINIT